ncbi:MAG: hypothetical protein ABIA74_04720 [bacterium]
MSNKSLNLISIALSLVFLSSCIKYYKISNQETPQGEHKKNDYTEMIQRNLKSKRVYDQFETKATFDCLWMSDEMKESYVDLSGDKKGKNDDEKDAQMRRQLEEGKHWLSFYVLADIRNKTHSSLTDKESWWSMYLDIDGEKVPPISIKEVELDPEIQQFFGSRFNRFKTPYLVKFPATDIGGKLYLQGGAEMHLIMNSPTKETKLTWSDKEHEKAMKILKWEGMTGEEDYYWG